LQFTEAVFWPKIPKNARNPGQDGRSLSVTEAIQNPIFPLKFTWRENRCADRADSYRPYDAQVGRFISRDPIGFKGAQTNLYGYTFNDPVNYVDPTGKNPAILPAFGIGFVVGFITGYVTQSELNPNSTTGQLLTAGLQTGVFTGGGAALAASGAGLVAAIAGEIAGVGLNVVTGPSSANVNLQDLSNGINAVQQSGKTCPPAGQ
jgi:RHS repeat-associated protein